MSDTATNLLNLAKSTLPRYERMEIAGIGEVFVKKLNAGERDRFEWASKKIGDGNACRSLTLIHFCYDERGARMFSDDDISTLDLLDPGLIDPVTVRALTYNGYTEQEQEDIRKNLRGQPANSFSG